jgi:hypothetical protein
VQRHLLADATGHFLNDLVVGDSGRVYVTDSGAPALYTTRPGSPELERFVDLRDFGSPNGIARLGSGQLVVAVPDGFVRVNTRTRALLRLALDPGVAVNYVDGLYVHGGALIAVEPWRTASEVGRYTLDDGATRVLAYEPITGGHPATLQPTTGTIVGSHLYYVANSQMRVFREALAAGAEPALAAPVILRVTLP